MNEIISALPAAAVNAGVFVGMVITTILGWKFGKKKAVSDIPEDATQAKVVGAVLQDNLTMMMASEAQRILAERVGTNTHVVERNTDMLKNVCHQLDQLNHTLDRLNRKD